ncbi:hypothetical protein EDB81DRAFT_779025 [Dactylonectria macrodidyma]|uniref:ABM domain-containing protein n=1 Tax=Dactylonectria macrodidyma TaxID=307937 RepID=A0A9P9FMM3_9HYPO|nr:hypothetical protein EDB81DRAFT_779025 [Dactylonectria macrodidyma]
MVYTIVVNLYSRPEEECINLLKTKLIDASRVYSKDKETISWFVMQDTKDPRAFTIVERYEKEDSQQIHLSNLYWKGFDPYVKPLLSKPMDLRRFNELDTSKAVVVPKYDESKYPMGSSQKDAWGTYVDDKIKYSNPL